MSSVCIEGISLDDAVNISHGLMMNGVKPVVENCDSRENLIYRIKNTWIVKIRGEEYRIGDEGGIVVNKPFNGLFYTGSSSSELTGFLTSEAVDERIFIGLLAGFLLKGLPVNDALQAVSEFYEYDNVNPASVVSRKVAGFKCVDRLFDAISRFLSHTSIQEAVKGRVVFSCITERGLSYEVEIYLSRQYREVVRLDKIQRKSVKDSLMEDELALVCFEHLLFNGLKELEFDEMKWYCFAGKDPVRIVVEMEKNLNSVKLF
ncbi:hypothetical protein IMZ38_05095 [Thermosphaera chiliense]|uniref:Uncharacterized protein n=1 Tax=Thermosphaera chiliense TaxID=3402707 RepID=A0A7M1UP58_9CREN|nr:hypothetical protein [Thermosphaera aggregans]QOR94020.1 hypothetical protein IMZ38_05095 [Thermosphaera aggregans]